MRTLRHYRHAAAPLLIDTPPLLTPLIAADAGEDFRALYAFITPCRDADYADMLPPTTPCQRTPFSSPLCGAILLRRERAQPGRSYAFLRRRLRRATDAHLLLIAAIAAAATA